MFTDNGDGTYTVRFYHQLSNGTQSPEYVTVDKYLPTQDGNLIYANAGKSVTSTNTVLWAALAEKAYAQLATSGWSRPGWTKGYESLNLGQGKTPAASMQQIMGEKSLTVPTFNTLLQDVQAGMLVTLGSKYADYMPSGSPVIPAHVYYVTGYDATTKTFTVVNPYGWKGDGTLHLTLARIEDYFGELNTANS